MYMEGSVCLLCRSKSVIEAQKLFLELKAKILIHRVKAVTLFRNSCSKLILELEFLSTKLPCISEKDYTTAIFYLVLQAVEPKL